MFFLKIIIIIIFQIPKQKVLSKLVNLPYSSDIVEAMAATRAIYFAQEIGLNSFILEGDSEAVIKFLRSDDDSFSPFGHILVAAKATT